MTQTQQTIMYQPVIKEQLKTAQKQKKYDTHSLSPHLNPNINEQLPNFPIPPSLEVKIQWPWYPWHKWSNVMDAEV